MDYSEGVEANDRLGGEEIGFAFALLFKLEDLGVDELPLVLVGREDMEVSLFVVSFPHKIILPPCLETKGIRLALN
jgi:hypothetical protein